MNKPSVRPGRERPTPTSAGRQAAHGRLGAHVQAPRAPPAPAGTPNLHRKARRESHRGQVISPLPPPRPPSASQPPDGPRCPARTEARGNREIRTYGFIYQSAAAGHTAMELPAPPPSQPPQGGARGGARLPAIGLSGRRSVKLANRLTRRAGGAARREGQGGVCGAAGGARYRGP